MHTERACGRARARAPRGLVSIGAVSFVMCVSSFGTGNDGPCVAEGWMRSANVSILAILKIEQIRTEVGTGQSQAARSTEATWNVLTTDNVHPRSLAVRSRGRGAGGGCGPVAPHNARGRGRVAGRGARACSRRAGPARVASAKLRPPRDRDVRGHVPRGERARAPVARWFRTCIVLAFCLRCVVRLFAFALKSITARPPGNGHAKRHGTDRSGGTCGGVQEKRE